MAVEIEQPEQPKDVKSKLVRVSYTSNNWNMTKYVWDDIDPEESDIKIGDRVYPAGENIRDVFIVKGLKDVGSKFYPDGAVICSWEGGSERVFDFGSVIKHPEMFKTKKSKK